jgi:hypothetical protein
LDCRLHPSGCAANPCYNEQNRLFGADSGDAAYRLTARWLFDYAVARAGLR